MNNTDSTANILESRRIGPVDQSVLVSTIVIVIRHTSVGNMSGNDEDIALKQVFLQVLAEFTA